MILLLRFLTLPLFCLILCSNSALARPIVADLAIRSVDIDHDFNGIDILLFGARNDIGRIVVLLKGENRNYMVRKKEKVGGLIWMNKDHVEFKDVPSLYAVAATNPLHEIKNTELLHQLGIGLENIPIDAVPEHHSTRPKETLDVFRQALIKHKLDTKLYANEIAPVSFWEETLFRSMLRFPKNLERGWYTAEIYLFNDERLVAVQSTPIHVSKTGFEAFIFDLAHKNRLLYGILAVGIAVLAGWTASRVMGRH